MDPKCEFALETLGSIEVQRGNFFKGLQHFEKAIPLCNTELEMAHLFGLVNTFFAFRHFIVFQTVAVERCLNFQLSATKAQLKISGQLGPPSSI